jgi:Fe-S cluster assembly ATP-binding protein
MDESNLMIQLINVEVTVEDRVVLSNINLAIPYGETHVMFGPNGIGKTTLLKAIMGLPPAKVTSGKIIFKGKDITNWSIDERAREGIALTFQHPPEVRGLKMNDFMNMYGSYNEEDVQSLNLDYLIDRELNNGFSGGEIKRSELMQIKAQKPQFVMLDEPESGVDMEHMDVIGKSINNLLQRDRMIYERKTVSGLIITHTGFVMDYVNAEKGYVFDRNGVICQGHPRDIYNHIQKDGFERCETCMKVADFSAILETD